MSRTTPRTHALTRISLIVETLPACPGPTGLADAVAIDTPAGLRRAAIELGTMPVREGPLVYHPTPVRVLTRVVQVSVGSSCACARLRDGTVSCWGNNLFGQLGLGDTTTRDRPRPTRVMGVKGATELAAGGDHAGARQRDGVVL